MERMLLVKRSLGLAVALLAGTGTAPSLAQLTPDTTLGTRSSTVRTSGSIDTIEGGARSGSNLFHSFREFNVDLGRSLYFSDPGVSNILTRVTGTVFSSINGKLGVLGPANLFLINPNGIVFGPGASLDIRGSFTATTGAVRFSDGSSFSATSPTAASLLTIGVPLGLQRGGNSTPRTIVQRGQLQTGQDLTLAADRLDLQGSLHAGRHLTLQATETLQVRDTLTQPFLAQSGGNLTVQGDRGIDILALNHPAAAFRSGGDLSLVSDGVISGDARFVSGGNFQVRSVSGGLARFRSLYDPIISTTGDVDLALDYSGASLLIEAGGNIRIQGAVDITSPDVAAPFVGDDVVLNTQPGLVLRSGQTALRYSTSDAVPGSTIAPGLVTTPGITLQGRVTIAPDGVVNLTADGNGSISTQAITAPRGAIALTSQTSITTNGQTFDVGTDNGDGGSIRLTAPVGIATGDLIAASDASTNFGDAGNGGTITLSSANGNITTGQLSLGAFSYAAAGDGGTLSLLSPLGRISTGDITTSTFGNFGDVGHGGKVTIASAGEIAIGKLNSGQFAGYDVLGQPGTVSLASTNGNISTGGIDISSIAMFGYAVKGGTLTVSSGKGSITTGNLDAQSSGGSGGNRGGNITLSTVEGNITTGDVTAESSGYLGNANGNGGTIALTSRDGNVTTGTLNTRSLTFYFTTGNAGSITVTAGGDLRTDTISNYALSLLLGAVDASVMDRGNPLLNITGKGGTIALTSRNGSIQTGDLFSFSTGARDPGLFFDGSPEEFRLVNQFFRANFHDVGGDIRLSAAQNLTTGLISTISSGGSGSIVLSAGDTITAIGNVISSDTFGAGKAGDISLVAQTVLLKDGTQLSASTHGSGNGGNIAVTASQGLELSGTSVQPPTTTLRIQTPIGLTVIPDVYLGGYLPTGNLDNIPGTGGVPSGIFVQNTIDSTGNAGNIQIQAGQLLLNDQGTIAATTFGSGAGGNVTVNAGSIQLDNGSIFSGVAPGAMGDSGTIDLTTQSLNLTNQGRVQALTLGTGKAGDIQVQSETVTIAGALSGITSGSGDSEQRGGAIGAGGNIRLNTNTLQVADGGLISAATYTEGRGGTIEITANQVGLLSQGKLSATTQGLGQAGSITVTARDGVTISGDLSGITSGSGDAEQRGGQIGAGGNIRLNTDRLQVADGGLISAATYTDGRGGTIEITANQVGLLSQGKLSATTQGPGQAGSITVTARDGVTISGDLSGITSGSGDAEQRGGQVGDGGNIRLNTNTLQVADGGLISAATYTEGRGGTIEITANQVGLLSQGKLSATTQGLGQAGSITVTARDQVVISGDLSGIVSGSGDPSHRGGPVGDGGNIRLNTDRLKISDSGIISASTFTQGQGGTIEITANQVDLLSQGRLSATTQNQGQAGNITVNSRQGVTIDGSQSGLFANTTPQSSGKGGSIFLTTAALRLGNNARITVESQGQGSGGDIQLTLNRLNLDNGSRIVAETASTQGGNIQIQARDFTLLRRGSLISATAGTAQAGGNGGNVTIATPNGFVVGVLAENSDIRANAFTGNGGQVNITAQGIFGLTFQPRDTPKSDITASSQFGVNGTVTLNTLNIDPNRGLVALPSGFSEANQVAQTCAVQQGGNSFVVTGRGGLSPDPSEAVTQTQLWTDGAPAQSRSTPAPPSSPALVEATGLQKNSDGSTSLVAPGEPVTASVQPHCQTLAAQER